MMLGGMRGDERDGVWNGEGKTEKGNGGTNDTKRKEVDERER